MVNRIGHVNEGYYGTLGSTTSIPGAYKNGSTTVSTISLNNSEKASSVEDHELEQNPDEKTTLGRDQWSNDLEFLMSCIALSVGLGNVWRFPFTALENGGGAFVIPYIIVLFLVGKPVYYMEMILGQFSSRGSVNVFDFSPIMRGVGYGQVLATGIVTTYYATLMAITLRYLVASFSTVLPWSYCREEWGSMCVDSKMKGNETLMENVTRIPSAQFYFTNIVLREKASIDDGIGYPSWELSLCLLAAWIMVAAIMIQGVRSSGKASYFLALFPYAVMLILLIRALTLPGAFDGVLYFIKPQWDRLLDPKVWYAAVTQVFFSLAICFGNIIMYASYNRFGHNVYRDANIVTTLDTFTSLLSGVIIFGILGNLAYESNTTDIKSVVKGGTGLAFVSYPDAISKFNFVPQLFSVLFFLMLFVLGIGSNVGMASCIMTVIKDKFSSTKNWVIVMAIAVVGFSVGLIYLTPGGQFLLNFLDFYGASFVALVLAIVELVAVGWIYGVKRLCQDIHFMLGLKTSIYYRICWAVVTPAVMAAILVYTFVDYKPLDYNGYIYSDGLYIFGWCLSAFGILQVLFWGIYAVAQQPKGTLLQKIVFALRPQSDWGPLDKRLFHSYKLNQNDNSARMFRKNGFWFKIYDNIFG
ncbi:sodium-dependent nutrient amino acid transporter 1-like [Eupeodes corollae]|uniref:sodium-dependent nutrient amino acid transporter 1-like n=1 Tax=Eupeodes corollae TaxID=290404 RepID=UPI0024901A1E|nr:sodium-dependent nutrient amino acid transporter 1-like [Eupeodes corollae]XP_055906519.1 sodium-dependent nutrient amino acid transporter 1-like [Eupeodes corollae]